MTKFEIWMDESGDFHYDAQKRQQNKKPSLIGGILSKRGEIGNVKIDMIIQDTFHCIDNKDTSAQIDKLTGISMLPCEFVVFHNEECIMIIDNNLTYQNIMAEGLIQLIKYLKGRYGDIFLDILIANRVDTTTGLSPQVSLVQDSQYITKLNERMLMSGLKQKIGQCWQINTASARRDKRLMLADIVCNSFLTREANKFTQAQKEMIASLYQSAIKFTVFESAIENQFTSMMAEGRIGEAILTICQSDQFHDKYLDMVGEHFKNVSDTDILLHYEYISLRIRYLLKVSMDYDHCLHILLNLQQYLVPLLEHSIAADIPGGTSIALKLKFDIAFFLFTVHTHKGDICESEKYRQVCSSTLGMLDNDWEHISYKLDFRIRESIHYLNTLDFDQSIQCISPVIHLIEDMKEALELVPLDHIHSDNFSSDTYAKALGTRLQGYCHKIRHNPECYDFAILDSETAIREFDEERDRLRQYQYRAQIECEAHHFEHSLEYLYKAGGVKDHQSINALVQKSDHSFLLMHIMRLIAEGKLYQYEKADPIYQALNSSNKIKEYYSSGNKQYHPYEIISWKEATYLALSGRYQGAMVRYQQALEACFYEENYTLWCIGIAVMTERLAFAVKYDSKDVKKYKMELEKKLCRYMELANLHRITDSMAKLFEDMAVKVELKFETLLEISRRVTY